MANCVRNTDCHYTFFSDTTGAVELPDSTCVAGTALFNVSTEDFLIIQVDFGILDSLFERD